MAKYFFEQAATYVECEKKVREKYGDRARILTHRTVPRGGFFGIFAKEWVELSGPLMDTGDSRELVSPEAAREGGAGAQILYIDEEKKKFQDLLRKGDGDKPAAKADKPVLERVEKNPMEQVLAKLETIEKEIHSGSFQKGTDSEEPAAVKKIEELLEKNDFSPAYIRAVLEWLRRDFSLEDLQDYDLVQDRVVEWVGDSIRIDPGPTEERKPRMMVLVGPTGVGKTTAIAKLAAVYGLQPVIDKLQSQQQELKGRRAVRTRMITIDAFKIGALAQLQKYSTVLEIPMSKAEKAEELADTIQYYRGETDLFLVDTIGRGPKDFTRLGEMRQILEGCGSEADVYLVIAAPTKTSNIRDILQLFEQFSYRSVIVTKLDEASRLGNVISALWERGKSISFISDGQVVPSDICRARVVRFLMSLEGFRVDREAMEKRFPNLGFISI